MKRTAIIGCLSFAAIGSAIVTSLVTRSAPAEETLAVNKMSSVKLPNGWSTERAQNRGAMVQAVRKGSEGDIQGHVVITTETRRDHAEAVHRLMEIAAEQSAKPEIVTIDGWPALVRKRVGPMPQPGEAGAANERKLVTITVAVAADMLLVRAEGFVAIDFDRDQVLSREIEAIGRSLTFGAHGNVAQTSREVEMLRKSAVPAPPRPRLTPPTHRPPPPPPRGLRGAGGEHKPGAATAVRGGVGELEVAVTNAGAGPDNVVVAGNSGVSFSNNGGVTFSGAAFSPGFGRDGDLSLAVGESKNVYMSFIGFPKGEKAALGATGCTDSVAVSKNFGKTFSFLSHAVICGSTVCTPDQEHIAADQFFTGTGSADQLYLVWRNFTPSGKATCPFGGSEVASIVCSPDGGKTWPTTQVVDSSGDFPRVAVGSDSSVFVAYRSGSNVMLNKFSSCSSGLNQQGGFPVTVASVNDIPCPVPGLDRCNNGNVLSSQMVAIDHTDGKHIFVAWATNTTAANDDIIVADSTDGGASFKRTVRVNKAVNGRRFMPWVCTIGNTAHVTWYDRRAVSGNTTDDLTAYFRGSASAAGGGLTAGAEVNESGNNDPECASGWPTAPRSSGDATSCSTPQLAGFCLNAAGKGSATRCNFSSPACPAGESCRTGNGAPKYGDYNGNACGANHVYAAWASATAPTGATAAGGGINVYVDAIHCGDLSEPCCKGTTCNKTSLVCDASKICSCGALNQPCCDGSTCSPGFVCATSSGPTNTCQCGGLSQPCCSGTACNSPLLTCSAAKGNECVSACGHRGEPCCHSSPSDTPPTHSGSAPGWCYNGEGLSCVGDSCSCGGKDQACCQPGSACGFGLTCANLLCIPPTSGGVTCSKCTSNLTMCIKGCATDPAHKALCECLCQNTACDCRQQNSCGLFCQAQSCSGP